MAKTKQLVLCIFFLLFFTLLGVVLTIIIFSRDDSQTTTYEADKIVSLGEQTFLKINEVLEIKNEDIFVKFVNVREDTRCPTDSECLTAGSVIIVMNFQKDGVDLGNYEIEFTPNSSESISQEFDSHSVLIKDVKPEQTSEINQKKSEYEITIMLEKL